MLNKINDESLLAEIEEVIRAMPPRQKMRYDDDETLAWCGRVRAVFNNLDPVHQFPMTTALDRLRGNTGDEAKVRELILTARHDLRMRTVGPLSIAVDAGSVFNYFDGLAKIIQEAKSDILFVDPYLDKDFVGRYLPQVSPSAQVRLLGSKDIPALVPAVQLFGQQHSLGVEVRSSAGLHDRYVFIDGSSCYQSGASFKDGGKKSTTLTQIVDAFPAVKSTYEAMWQAGKTEYP